MSNAVNNLQRKYALQDPLEEVVATESAKKRKREDKDTHLSSTGNKRGKLVSAPDTSTKKRSIIESRHSGSKVCLSMIHTSSRFSLIIFSNIDKF